MIAQRDKQVRNRSKRLGNGRFAPGVSGNPKGRPKIGASLSELIRDELDRPMRGGRTRKQRLAEVIVERALAGDHRFCRLIFERTEPTQPVNRDDEAVVSVEDWLFGIHFSATSNWMDEESRAEAKRLLKALDRYDRWSEAREREHPEANEAAPRPIPIQSKWLRENGPATIRRIASNPVDAIEE